MKKIKQFLKLEVRDRMVYYLVRIMLYVIRPMPMGVMRRIASFLGTVVWCAMFSIRKVVLANLAVAFPEKSLAEHKSIGRNSIYHLIATTMEMFWLNNRKDRIQRYVKAVSGAQEVLDRLRTQGNGVIGVVPHIGSWEAAGMSFGSLFNFQLTSVARPFRNRFLHEFVNKNRIASGNIIVPSQGAAKGMFRALKKGEGVGTLIDQNVSFRDGAIWSYFFGLPVATSRAPAMFSVKAKSPVLLAYCLRTTEGYAFNMVDIENPSDDELILTQQIMDLTQKIIRENPDQYLWFYKRFRFIPKSSTDELAQKYPFYASRLKQDY